MRVPYGEGPASHTGPESCGDDREAVVEALTGVRAGRVLSLDNLMARDTGMQSVSETDCVPVSACGRF
jgi:hypothetical protein